MSRCFPFPPPGYESHRSGSHVDLLAEEKHKEKKHKKEKRDKEKREGKERKDKDRSKDKHKEKKDRKEKHKDRKKDKDKHKDNRGTSEDQRNDESIESLHQVKIGQGIQRPEEVKDTKFTEEHYSRIRNEDKTTTISVVRNITGSIQRNEGVDAVAAMETGMGKCTEMVPNSIGISQRRNGVMSQSMDNSAGPFQRSEGPKTMDRDTGNRTTTNLTTTQKTGNHGMNCGVDNSTGSTQEKSQGTYLASIEKEKGASKVSNSRSTTVSNLTNTDQRKNHGIGRPVVNITPRRAEGMHSMTLMEKERGRDQTMALAPISTTHGNTDSLGRPLEDIASLVPRAPEKERRNGDLMLANHISSDKKRSYVSGSLVVEEKSIERKARTADGEASIWKGEKHAENSRNEKNKLTDKDRRSEKEKEEIMRKRPEHKHRMESYSGKDLVDRPSVKPLAPRKDDGNAIVDGTKRKDMKINGFMHEDEQPRKLMRTGSFSRPPLENGSKLEPSRVDASNLNGATNNIRVTGLTEKKEHRINGTAEFRSLSVESRPKDRASTAVNDTNRKDIKINGFTHEDGQRNKLIRTSSTSHLSLDNGRKFEPSHVATSSITDNKEHKMNGAPESRPLSVESRPKDNANDVNDRKRKDINVNGHLHEDERPNKLMRTSSFSHPPLENGSNLERSHVPTPSILTGVTGRATGRPDTKEHKTNGAVEPRQLSVESRHKVPREASEKKDRVKPPHRDSKFLSQIYTVPKMEEWPEFDDQKWLFGENNLQPATKTKVEVEETPQVWAGAMHIDSADVMALPYVIPF